MKTANISVFWVRESKARVFLTYYERWRFRHPASEDFYAVASEVSGRDLDWFFEETIESPGFLDYEVAAVRTERAAPPGGILEDGATVTSSAPPEEAEDTPGDEESWRSVVRVRRRGEVVLPVEVELQFEGGAPERRHWDGRDRRLLESVDEAGAEGLELFVGRAVAKLFQGRYTCGQ